MILFQAPWLPELIISARDQRFLDAAFKTGKWAPRSPGAITDEDIQRWQMKLQSSHCVLIKLVVLAVPS